MKSFVNHQSLNFSPRCLSGKHQDTFFVILAFMMVLPLWVTNFIPLQDYPDWLYQGKIFADYHRPGIFYKDFISLKPVIIASSATTLILGFLIPIFEPIISGKIMLSLWVILFPLAYLYFYRSFNDARNILEFLPVLLIYNIRFYNGNLNFLFSLPLFFFIIGYLRRRIVAFGLFDSLIVMAYLGITFAFHFMGYCFALFGIAALAIFYKLNLKKYLYLILSIFPSFVMALIYIDYQAGYKGQLISVYHYSVIGKLANLINTWAVFFSFDNEPYSRYWILKMLVNLLFSAIIFLIAIPFIKDMLNGKWRKFAFEWVGVILFIVGLSLPTMFYYVTAGDTRLFFTAFLIILPSINGRMFYFNMKKFMGFLVLYLAVISIHAGQFYFQGSRYHKVYEKIESSIPQDSKMFIIMGDYMTGSLNLSPPEINIVRKVIAGCIPGIAGLMRIPYYYYINNNIAYPHIFQTSIFESSDRRIPLMINPYPNVNHILSGIDYYDYVTIVGQSFVIERFNALLADKTVEVSLNSSISILKVKK